jgi:serine/threonine protein kinase/Leucine-rich repeat (LRR) protein
MTANFEQVQSIFMAAIERPTEEWEAYLAEACGTDAALRERVETLLRAHQSGRGLLDSPVAWNPATAPPPGQRPITESTGTVIGRYKLLQQIGEGGMGVVYMAEQEKPVRRRVALKIIKPGMDSSQVIARFEAERQALAMMDHPNIARVLDAGCTDSGRPFFVMELVQGIPVTKYCDDKLLNTTERLELFIHVCNAIQHAHQKGIIHRDLKPSNVLIAIYDAKPVPKIIDFGVAKALHQRLTEKTMFTQFGAVVGTLEYMSPEQADMDLMGTDTRSDIYSLGVLLYELLTGSTPLDGKKLRSLGYAEMLKTIREVDPPKPSTRLTQSRDDMPNISARRQTEPRRLQKLIAGDLDWIVMKCLEKDRARRYETANGLAMDIQRHLQDEAVSASPPGQLYKFQKLVRRNKLVFAAVACVMLALVLGLAASLWQAGRAAREAERARQEADRANAALNDLRAAAPSIAAEALALAAQERFDDAIAKLDYAAKLRPDVADYVTAKADLLETQLRLADAAAVYRAALKLKPDDARAMENAELCEQLAAAPKGADGKISRESLARLSRQMTADQRPAAEIMPIARALGDEKEYIVNYWLDRLKDLPNGTDRPIAQRLTVRDDGLLKLDLSHMQIADLSPLPGMPLGTLDVSACIKVSDLSPLKGMSLTELCVSGTGVTSLEPLRGMSSLQKLTIGQKNVADRIIRYQMNEEVDSAKVADLSPLVGLRLKEISLAGCPVTSIEPLRGMPLEELNIRSTGVIDLSPIKGMPLKMLDISHDAVHDFTPLAGLPLDTLFLEGVWVGDLGFLKGLPLKQLSLFRAADARHLEVLSEIRTLEVLGLPDISNESIADFSAVENLRTHPSLKQLAEFSALLNTSLASLPSKDEFWKNWNGDHAWALRLRKAGFSFDRGLGYFLGKTIDLGWSLDLNHQPFSDLSILVGANINILTLTGDRVTNLAPLKGLPLMLLDLSDNPVEDLSPLVGMTIWDVRLGGCEKLKDVTPLSQMSGLRGIILPPHAANLEPLRKLPKLLAISFGNTRCTPDTFWKTWDGLPWARKLEAAGMVFSIDQSEDGYYGVTVNDPKFIDCSVFTGSKNIHRLDLQGSGVANLSPLENLPLESLDVRETPVSDLSALNSPVLRDSLTELRLWKTKVTDFSPVAGCSKLTMFDAADTQLSDLSIIKGMKLHDLLIERTAVADVSVVAGMPLANLAIGGTPVIDISALLKCPTLTSIVLPQGAVDVKSLHALLNLSKLSYTSKPGGIPDMSAGNFWSSVGDKPELPLAALDKANIKYTTRHLKDGTWELTLDNQPIVDLSILNGANISRLYIAHTQVADLSPVRSMPIGYLRISYTKVTDLRPLRGIKITNLTMSGTDVSDLRPLVGLPLRVLNMTDCVQIKDLSPLLEIKTLETVILPQDAANIEVLRKHANLKRLGYKNPGQPAGEFWAEYDHKQKAAGTQPSATASRQP